MSGRWFRFYEESLNNPKVQRLPGDLFKAWVNLLCLASHSGGQIKSLADAAFALRLSEQKAGAIIAELARRALLDRVDAGYFAPHDWNERQYKSDTSNDRVKRHRQRYRNAECNVTETVTVTPPEQSRAETEIDDGGERPDLALTLASELAAICGYPTPDDWPAGWCGSPHWVQKCLNEGWLPEVMRAETEATVKRKRDGPIEHFSYLEKPLARAHAKAQAPLPKVEIPTQETIYAQPGRGGERRNELRDVLRELRNETGGGETSGPHPSRLLSHG